MVRSIAEVRFCKNDDFESLITAKLKVRYLCTITDKFEGIPNQLKANPRKLFEPFRPEDFGNSKCGSDIEALDQQPCPSG